MSFSVDLYQNESPVEKIGKTLSNSHTISDVVLKRDTSILRPVLLINSVQDIYTYNYMYISEFGRYYFIDDIRSVNNNMWEISAHVDVLETYKTDILSNTAVLKRQEKKFNLYLDDPEFKVLNNYRIQTKRFAGTSGWTKQLHYVLVTNGA
jgi:hypothetical protein